MNSYMKEIESFLADAKSLDEKPGAKGHTFDELQPTDSSMTFDPSEDHWCKIRTRNQLLIDQR